MIDYQMMSRFVRGFSSLMHGDKPTVVKIHGYCVAGGTDIALHADQVIAAADAKIGYPPMRVWGVPAAGLWAHRLGDQRAKRLLFTGDCVSGAQAAEWGLASRRPTRRPRRAHRRTPARIAAMPVNQLIMAKLALNTALLQQGVATSRMVSTVFDGVARHTPEGHAFVAEAREHGFREAVRSRDEPFGDQAEDLRCRRWPHAPAGCADDRAFGRAEVLLGAHPASATAGRIIRLTADFDIKESTLRVALTRMVSTGDLVRSEDGYRLSDRLLARQRRQDDAIARAPGAWHGTWMTWSLQLRRRRAHSRRFADDVAAHRFGELREGVWLRPDNVGRSA